MAGFGFSGFSVRLASHVSPDSLSAGFAIRCTAVRSAEPQGWTHAVCSLKFLVIKEMIW